MMLRQTVSELMVRIHQISPELAAYHVREMAPSEVKRRFLMYVRPGGDAPRAERQDAVVIETGPTVTHSVPVPDAANKPTTADRKSEAPLPSVDSRLCLFRGRGCSGRSSRHQAKSGRGMGQSPT
jgi:hypothetical protein